MLDNEIVDQPLAAVISNTQSGYNRKHGIEQLAAVAAKAGLLHFPIVDIQELDAALQECAQRHVGLLILNSGDGTVCAVLQRLRENNWFLKEPSLALLCGGTTNMIHKDVGCPGSPVTALRKLIDALPDGRSHVTERRPLRIRESQRVARYGFFFATNAVVRAILQTRRTFHRLGSTGWTSESLTVLSVLFKLLLRRVEQDPILAPVNIECSNGGQTCPSGQQILMVAFTLHRLILGLQPLAAQRRSGWAILPWPDYRLFSWLRSFVRGQSGEINTLTLRGAFCWALDGEIYDHRQDDGELAIDIAAPARFVMLRKPR